MPAMEMFSFSPLVLISMSKMAVASSLVVIKGCNTWTILPDNCIEEQE